MRSGPSSTCKSVHIKMRDSNRSRTKAFDTNIASQTLDHAFGEVASNIDGERGSQGGAAYRKRTKAGQSVINAVMEM
jgi:hypothetical protein